MLNFKTSYSLAIRQFLTFVSKLTQVGRDSWLKHKCIVKRGERGKGEINKMLRSVCSDRPAAGLVAGAGQINKMDAALHCWE